jgi:hypothetical protein
MSGATEQTTSIDRVAEPATSGMDAVTVIREFIAGEVGEDMGVGMTEQAERLVATLIRHGLLTLGPVVSTDVAAITAHDRAVASTWLSVAAAGLYEDPTGALAATLGTYRAPALTLARVEDLWRAWDGSLGDPDMDESEAGPTRTFAGELRQVLSGGGVADRPGGHVARMRAEADRLRGLLAGPVAGEADGTIRLSIEDRRVLVDLLGSLVAPVTEDEPETIAGARTAGQPVGVGLGPVGHGPVTDLVEHLEVDHGIAQNTEPREEGVVYETGAAYHARLHAQSDGLSSGHQGTDTTAPGSAGR